MSDERTRVENYLRDEAAFLAENLGEAFQKRLLNYRPSNGNDYHCPRCWIQSETEKPLRDIPHPANQPGEAASPDDVLSCDACSTEFFIPSDNPHRPQAA
jgi:hypothetical protein